VGVEWPCAVTVSVIGNLMSNALTHTPPCTPIDVDPRPGHHGGDPGRDRDAGPRSRPGLQQVVAPAGQPNAPLLAIHSVELEAHSWSTWVTKSHDEEFVEYVSARMPGLRRLALLLCHDWHGADDLVQAAITKLYVAWAKARTSDSIDAYVRTILIREYLHEQRAGWARRVTLTDHPPEFAGRQANSDVMLDVQAAIAALPPRQRAVLILRYHCDLNVDQAAHVLGCSTGTVKSQTSKAMACMRRALGPAADADPAGTHPARINIGPGEDISNA
jgi:RNA polymerase sigma-70 factor (sigma-E family)